MPYAEIRMSLLVLESPARTCRKQEHYSPPIASFVSILDLRRRAPSNIFQKRARAALPCPSNTIHLSKQNIVWRCVHCDVVVGTESIDVCERPVLGDNMSCRVTILVPHYKSAAEAQVVVNALSRGCISCRVTQRRCRLTHQIRKTVVKAVECRSFVTWVVTPFGTCLLI